MIRKSPCKKSTAIKICGITKTSQAKSIAQLRINAIGVIGVKKSPRFVPEEECIKIFNEVEKVSSSIEKVFVIANEKLEEISSGVMTKAGRLAMELANEKKRLNQELKELQAEYDEVKPTTPTGTRDWYVKWLSMILAVLGVFLISASYTFYGQITYFLSAIGWIYVGMQWGDRAIMIGSAVTGTAVAMSLIENLPKYLSTI